MLIMFLQNHIYLNIGKRKAAETGVPPAEGMGFFKGKSRPRFSSEKIYAIMSGNHNPGRACMYAGAV
jgi:hypothetical protein